MKLYFDTSFEEYRTLVFYFVKTQSDWAMYTQDACGTVGNHTTAVGSACRISNLFMDVLLRGGGISGSPQSRDLSIMRRSV
jgi:hypothetical protein